MEASMRMRLDLIDDLLQQHLSLTDTAPVKSDMMQEFEVVLTQMPYVGGAESRMSDFFMRLLGFMAIGRVLQRRGVPKDVIAELELESFKRHMLSVPEAERLEAGRSEEHTSELQSLTNLVCRLLLEKKKKKNTYNTNHLYTTLRVRL